MDKYYDENARGNVSLSSYEKNFHKELLHKLDTIIDLLKGKQEPEATIVENKPVIIEATITENAPVVQNTVNESIMKTAEKFLKRKKK